MTTDKRHARPFAEVRREVTLANIRRFVCEAVVFFGMIAVLFLWLFLLAPAPVTAP